MSEITTELNVDYAVFSSTKVAGWPPDTRQLLRVGVCSITDLDAQAMSGDERSFCLESNGEHQPISPNTHAVKVAPGTSPRIVPRPEASR